jgi:hypothetical protein
LDSGRPRRHRRARAGRPGVPPPRVARRSTVRRSSRPCC